jgi:acetyl esterase/lipase
MASEQSRAIRAQFSKAVEPSTAPLSVQRREWEDAAAQAPLLPGTTIEPVDAGGVHCEWVRTPAAASDRIMLFLHGGGFNAGSCVTHRELAARISAAAGAAVLLADYRLAPEHPFPAALDDTLAVYRWLLARGVRPDQILLGGDSAGGGLAASALLALRDAGAPQPAAAALISPWLDLALAGESLASRAAVDPLVSEPDLRVAAGYYVGERDPRDPLISPVYADLRGLPPLLIQVGDHELLLSDAQRLSDSASAAGVEFQLEVWPEMWHVWHAWAAQLPEGQAAIEQLGRFVRQHA